MASKEMELMGKVIHSEVAPSKILSQYLFFYKTSWVFISVRLLASYIAIPSFLFAALGKHFYMIHPLVNADYILLGVVSPWLPFPALLGSYFLLLLNEIIVNVAPMYNFSIGEFILSFRYIGLLNHKIIGEYEISILIGSVLMSYFAVKISKINVKKISLRSLLPAVLVLFISGVGICALDVLNGTSFIPIKESRAFANVNFAYSGLRRTILSLNAALQNNQAVFRPLGPSEIATGSLFDEISHSESVRQENIVLIVIESMGKYLDPQSQSLMLQPIENSAVKQRYSVHIREVPFHGSTIHGEFRELCGVRLELYGDKLPTHCLPDLYKEKHFETLAFHGFSNQFNARYQWYPKLGFDQIFFAEDLQKLGISKSCGASFTGICDTDVLAQIRSSLIEHNENNPKFLYWMTLNSHLPVSTSEGLDSQLDCSKSKVMSESPTLCTYAHLIDQVISGVAELAMDPALLPTRFILVGDHAPPFKSLEHRGHFSNETVTSIELAPRDLSKFRSFKLSKGTLTPDNSPGNIVAVH